MSRVEEIIWRWWGKRKIGKNLKNLDVLYKEVGSDDIDKLIRSLKKILGGRNEKEKKQD